LEIGFHQGKGRPPRPPDTAQRSSRAVRSGGGSITPKILWRLEPTRSRMRKGRLRQVMEKARFVKGNYRVQFRDKKRLAEVSIDDFWEIADIIPEHRVARILLDGEVVYQSSKSELLALPVEQVTDVGQFRMSKMSETSERT